MRQEIALEQDGAPVVRAFRSADGQLVFRYLTVRAGGMAVWAPVAEDIIRALPADASDLDRRLRGISLGLARSIVETEAESLQRVDELEGLVESLQAQLGEAHRQLDDLERRAVPDPPAVPDTPADAPSRTAKATEAAKAKRQVERERREREQAAA